MGRLFLTYAGRDYDRTRAIIDGSVEPKGLELNYLVIEDPDWIFRRMLSREEFDACEFSLSSYIRLRAQGDGRFVGLPIFPSRLFRHSYIFCNAEAGIREPQDLVGRKVGIMEWQQTTAVWVKGILQHEYDVPLERITWVRFRPERYPLADPKGFTIIAAPGFEEDARGASERASRALEEGTIDALIDSRPPSSLYSSRRVRRLFEDWVGEEVRYYRKTGIFPIMHLVILKRSIHEAHPWVKESLLEAFEEAKLRAYSYLKDHGDKLSLAWARRVLEDQLAVLGEDPYPYGLEPNRRTIEALAQYQVEQGILEREPNLEELFP